MSKVIKSNQFKEALPCRLEPADLDAFFIDEPCAGEQEAAGLDETIGDALMDESDEELSISPEEAANAMLARAEEMVKRAYHQSEEIIAEAHRKAEGIIAQAKKDGVKLSEDARRQGWQNGHEEGLRQAHEELASRLAEAMTLVTKGEEERNNRLASSELDLLNLATAIAEKIIGAELSANSLQKLNITREALSKVVTANSIVIRVSIADQSLFEENMQYLQEVFNAPKALKLIPDTALAEGNCFIETEFGTVDPRIKFQLERIAAELLKVGSLK